MIPESVVTMQHCFESCSALRGRVVIKTVLLGNNVDEAFEGVHGITLFVSSNSVAAALRDDAFEVGNKPSLSDFHYGPPWPEPGE